VSARNSRAFSQKARPDGTTACRKLPACHPRASVLVDLDVSGHRHAATGRRSIRSIPNAISNPREFCRLPNVPLLSCGRIRKPRGGCAAKRARGAVPRAQARQLSKPRGAAVSFNSLLGGARDKNRCLPVGNLVTLEA
jgi:hypothetical protein